MRATAKNVMFVIVGIVALTTVSAGTSNAGLHVGFTYRSAPADVQVWMGSAYDDGGRYYDYYNGGYEYDVYPSENDVVLYVRASRSCYTTVYVIDTEGFVHVVHPLSPAHDAYLIGGRVYRYRLSDYGFYGPCFDRGVAYAFAVGSPVPFNYASYGAGIFGPRIGFRIYGDPFVASRMFYVSILPAACHWNFVGVSYARFYVREYRRYPGYLCAGWHHHHGVRTHCRGNCMAHRQYRVHAADPYRVIHPRREFRPQANEYAKIDRTASKDIRDIRMVSEKRKRGNNARVTSQKMKRTVETSHTRTVRSTVSKRDARRIGAAQIDRDQAQAKRIESARRSQTNRVGSKVAPKVSPREGAERERVVRSTRNSFIKSKSEFSKMREKLVDKNTNAKGVKKASPKKTEVSKRDEPQMRKDSQKNERVARNSTRTRTDKRAKSTKK